MTLLSARVARLVGVGTVAGQVAGAVTVVAEGLPAAPLRLRVGAVARYVARLVTPVADVLTGRAVASHVAHAVTLVALLCGSLVVGVSEQLGVVNRGCATLRYFIKNHVVDETMLSTWSTWKRPHGTL